MLRAKKIVPWVDGLGVSARFGVFSVLSDKKKNLCRRKYNILKYGNSRYCTRARYSVQTRKKEAYIMPMLRCSAITCLYNEQECCSKGDIMVSGEQAHRADETNCESFVERKNGSVFNSAGCGCDKINIQCKAHGCVYNDSEKCEAAQVNIAGSNASVCQDTKCGTFECCK